MLENLAERFYQEGITPSSGLNSDFTSPVIKEALDSGMGRYEIRRLIARDFWKTLSESRNVEDAHTAEAAVRAFGKYSRGRIITVDGLRFFKASRATAPYNGKYILHEKKYHMAPIVNNAGNTLLSAGGAVLLPSIAIAMPIYYAGVPEAIIPVAIGAGLVGAGAGMKMLAKAVKSAATRGRNFFSPMVYGLAGAGGISYMFQGNENASSAENLCGLVFMGLLGVRFLQAVKNRKSIKDKLPSLEEAAEDLHKQIAVYNAFRDKYRDAELRKIGKKDVNAEANFLNTYMAHHMKSIQPHQIDLELDSITGKISGAIAHADVFTNTAELSTEKVLGVSSPFFAKIYTHEAAHLDQIINEGGANFRAHKVLEDLAVYNPDEGYDLQIEHDKLVAVGHVYGILLNEERKKRKEKPLSKEEFTLHLMDFGLRDQFSEGLFEAIQGAKDEGSMRDSLRAFGKEWGKGNKLPNLDNPIYAISHYMYQGVKGSIFRRMQWLVGGSDVRGGYTVDFYKLLKRENIY
ncbi:MAG: hypothetical protein ABIB71_02445 [Candidatus Woesearchaeota archaeon]